MPRFRPNEPDTLRFQYDFPRSLSESARSTELTRFGHAIIRFRHDFARWDGGVMMIDTPLGNRSNSWWFRALSCVDRKRPSCASWSGRSGSRISVGGVIGFLKARNFGFCTRFFHDRLYSTATKRVYLFKPGAWPYLAMVAGPLWRSAGAYAGVRPNGRPRLRSAQIAPAGKSTVGRAACKQTLGQRPLYDGCARSLTSRRQRRRTDRPGSAITRCLREYELAGVTTGAVARLPAKQPRPVVKLDPDASLPLLTWRDIAPYAEHGLHGHVRFVDSVGQLHASKRSASIRHTWANSRFAHGHRSCI